MILSVVPDLDGQTFNEVYVSYPATAITQMKLTYTSISDGGELVLTCGDTILSIDMEDIRMVKITDLSSEGYSRVRKLEITYHQGK